MSARLAEQIVRLRWVWVVLTLVILAVSVVGLGRLSMNPTARVFFGETNPDRIALDQFETEFAKDDNLMFVLVPKGGDVFTPRMLALQGRITECMWRLPFVRRVNSVTNFQNTTAQGDDLLVQDLVPDLPYGQEMPDGTCDLAIDPAAVTLETAQNARAVATTRVELANSTVSADGRVVQVQALFKFPETDKAHEVPMTAQEAFALRDQVQAAFEDVEVRLGGSLIINNQFASAGEADGKLLTPLMILAVLLVVALSLGSVFAMLITLLLVILSAVTALGALGWSGVPLNTVTVLSYLYIFTLAVAGAVHILASVRQSMVDTADRKEWARRALRDHMVAIAVACVTTAIGFFSLNFSISPPFQELGSVVGFGVLVAGFFTLTLVPALITFLPIRRQLKPAMTSRAMVGLGEFVIARRKILLPGMGLLVALLIAGIPQLKLEDDFLRYFDTRFEMRRDADFIEANLTGINALEWPLNSGEAEGVNDPDYLKKVAGFVEWMRAHPQVTAVRSVTDTVARLNMNMHGDDPSYHRLPDARDEASQYLFLYELSLNYGMDLTDQINVDRSTLRVSVFLANVTTADMRVFTEDARAWLRANAPELDTAPTGLVHVFNLISHRDVRAMLSGSVLALVLISAVLLIVLRDWKIGLISLIPNLVPAVMAFGLWGYSVGAVTLAIAVVLAATLGIVVDDTVHFLSKYVKARREGHSPEDAVRYVFRNVGMALFVTTIALLAGFGILAQSGFAVNGDLAKLTAITIAFALLADFLLLPPLLIAIDKFSEKKEVTGMPMKPAAALIAIALLGGGAAMTLGSQAWAQSAEEKGLAITQEADKRDLGWGDQTVQGEMILRDANGNENSRSFQFLSLEDERAENGDKSVTVFDSPRDIRGTALLTHSKIEPADDDQWLYLPAIKKTKRISSSNRTGKFVSSEFSYEDLGSNEVADYDYKFIAQEPCKVLAGQQCFVVESYPKNAKSGYSKRVSWIDTAEYRLDQVEFYNRRGNLEKRLTFHGYSQYLGKYWRAEKFTMVNLQTGKETDLIWRDYAFRTGLGEGDFNAQKLARLAR
ncbi:MAG: outer membrane lipoprotein-sorting protein [Neomegalonema sp.]|nr:outer membrane lipoprotein-sorting protein [Neomegalonema sp.]